MNDSQVNTTTKKETPAFMPRPRVTERKIGTTTFIVSSRFKEGAKRDVVSAITRLIQNDMPPAA